MRELGWGILGTGNIAHQFAEGVAGARRSRVVAVGSRAQANADAFAARFGVERAHGSYEALLADEAVEAVYVSLPNSMHHAWTLAALEAGKHVLCEKPLASNADEAEQMFAAAERHGRVLVEALMYRSHPITQEVARQVREGAIGELKLIRTSFCFRTRRTTAENIRFNAEMAGGALMDIGCYCLDFARLFAGAEPAEAHAVGQLHGSGVDEYAAGALRFESGVLATFACGMTVQTDNTAYLCGEEGYIEVPMPWKPPQRGARYVVTAMPAPRQDGGGRAGPPPRDEYTVDAPLPLYGLEADDFAATVLDGAEPRVSPAASLGNMRLLDGLRRQVGVGVAVAG